MLKPLPSNDVLRLAVGRAAERRRLVEENRRLREPLAPRSVAARAGSAIALAWAR